LDRFNFKFKVEIGSTLFYIDSGLISGCSVRVTFVRSIGAALGRTGAAEDGTPGGVAGRRGEGVAEEEIQVTGVHGSGKR